MIAIRNLTSAALAAAGLSLLLTAPASASDDPTIIPALGSCPKMAVGELHDALDQVVPIPCVVSLQQSLQAAGFTALDATGGYDAPTWEAVWNFQYAHTADGLEATGDADLDTILLLDQVTNSPAAVTEDNGADLDGNGEATPPEAPDIFSVTVVGETVDPQDGPQDCSTSCDRDYWIPVELYQQ
jgi:peptidoglycan hydrolase-like protein with peptidoglycan-binding domain